MAVKKNKKEVSKILFDLGFNLLKIKTNKYGQMVVHFSDKDGYRYESLFTVISKKYSKPRMVHISNPYSLKNIELWISKNKKSFKLLKNNKYSHSYDKLFLKCFKCDNKFKSNWSNIRGGNGCGVCKGKQVVKSNSLKKIRPDLSREWSSKNTFSPSSVSSKSGKIVLWECSKCGGEWKAKINDRNRAGCPFCSGRKILKENTIFNVCPELEKYWDYSKNIGVFPENLSPSSKFNCFWRCSDCNYEWKKTIESIFYDGGCPNCNGKILSKINFPNLVEEWDYGMNDGLLPNLFSRGSKKKIWWKCRLCKIRWNATIENRTYHKSGCPNCSGSSGENEIAYFLNKLNIDFFMEKSFFGCDYKQKLLFDFYLPEYETCIEFDGKQHFEPIRFGGITEEVAKDNFKIQKIKDKIKNKYCDINNLKLIRIPYWEFDNIGKILEKNFL